MDIVRAGMIMCLCMKGTIPCLTDVANKRIVSRYAPGARITKRRRRTEFGCDFESGLFRGKIEGGGGEAEPMTIMAVCEGS